MVAVDLWRWARTRLRTEYVAGLVCLCFAAGSGAAAWGQWRKAELIDAAPLTVTAVVDRVTAVKGGPEYGMTYRVAGHRYSTSRQTRVKGMTDPEVGTEVCLTVDSARPGLNRLCGERYPAGDDMMPTFILITLAGTVGMVCSAAFARSRGRERRSLVRERAGQVS